jgi:DNA-binding NarL/FixJ family response regulator
LPAGIRPPANLVPRSPHASPTIRLALLSDSVLLRSGLRSILKIERSFEVVAEGASPPVHDFVRSTSPHIILVDVQVEGALSVSSEFRENGARPRVILLGADSDEAWAVRALKSGARGILTKSATVEHLCKAVRVVHQGEVWASSRVVALSVEELASHSVPTSPGQSAIETRLSDREQEIVHLIVTGLNNHEAANQLGITEATVKAHLTHIFRKLSVHTRAQLAALYHRSAPALPKYLDTKYG